MGTFLDWVNDVGTGNRKREYARAMQPQTRAQAAAWARQDRRDAQRSRERAMTEAQRVRDQAQRDLEARERQAIKDAEARAAAINAEATAHEKRTLTEPVTRWSGATTKIKGPIFVWHYATSLPSAVQRLVSMDVDKNRGPLLALRPGGGLDPGRDAFVDQITDTHPEVLISAEGAAWRATAARATEETVQRYPVLAKLRDDRAFAKLLRGVGVCVESSENESVEGSYGIWSRKVTTINVPTLTDVRIERDGLVLTFAHRLNDTAKSWGGNTPDKLRSMFSNIGVASDRLVVEDGEHGTIVLRFRDRDPLAEPLAQEIHPYDVERGRSYVGKAADGSDVWLPIRNNALVLVAGMQGGGKTASIMPVLAGMAGHVELHVLDGAGSGEWSLLEPACASYDDSGDIDKLDALIKTLLPLARERVKLVTSKTGHVNFWDVTSRERESFGMYPIVVAVEEAPQYLAEGQLDPKSKEAAAANRVSTGKAVKVLRKAGITLILLGQKPTDKEIPSVVRDQAGARLCFRLDSDAASQTVLGDGAYAEPKPTSIPAGMPGRFVARVDARGNVLGQAVYVPVSQLRDHVSKAERVPDQRAMFDKPKLPHVEGRDDETGARIMGSGDAAEADAPKPKSTSKPAPKPKSDDGDGDDW